jgi:hypothetical protein
LFIAEQLVVVAGVVVVVVVGGVPLVRAGSSENPNSSFAFTLAGGSWCTECECECARGSRCVRPLCSMLKMLPLCTGAVVLSCPVVGDMELANDDVGVDASLVQPPKAAFSSCSRESPDGRYCAATPTPLPLPLTWLVLLLELLLLLLKLVRGRAFGLDSNSSVFA